MNLSRPDRAARLDALAALHVLGTLSPRTRARLARAATTDTAIAATIRRWEQRLTPLAEDVPPIPPPPEVWKRVALRLGLDPALAAPRRHWWSRLFA